MRPYQPHKHSYPPTNFRAESKACNRQFKETWYDNYIWLEYSIEKDAAFCFVCYLFKDKTSNRSDRFVGEGFRGWNRAYERFVKHIGQTVQSVHRQTQEKYDFFFFVNPRSSIVENFNKTSMKCSALYKARLTHSLGCLKFLLRQGLAFRGHDESEISSNKDNFREVFQWLADKDENVNKFVLKNAPGNSQMTFAEIQHDLIHVCAKETTKLIPEDIGDDYFGILADESSDVSYKEKLAIFLRYVYKKGRIRESFLGVAKVDDTCSLSLKIAIKKMVEDNKLSMSRVRGQGYDRASNMKGEINGLKSLIMNDTPSAYYIHCLAHQLQLTLISVAKDNYDCLNQELGLARASDTHSGSYYKTILKCILLSLRYLLWSEKQLSFESLFVFMAQLSIIIFGYTNESCQTLQRRDQDIVNAISFVHQGWEEFFSNVSTFCFKHDIEVLNVDDNSVPPGKSRRYFEKVINLHRFGVDMFISIIDLQLYELNNRFRAYEENRPLMSHINSFAAFDKLKLCRLAEFYPADFSSTDLRRLEFQLDHFIDDMWKDVIFKIVQDLGHLSTMHVSTNKHSSYQLVYLLLRLVLILPLEIASVERVFSLMTYVKNKLRNSMCDELLNDSLVTFIERDFFSIFVNDDIINRFQNLRTRRNLLPRQPLV
ncbi:hypothetical protein RND81_08G072800 [Saponaria officinalis]|uniref:TTF-type domain-containing protein n=1 Tax=Saponaria officinalis TaxID=3572 RepID=A0AAW1J3P4_SAPOF